MRTFMQREVAARQGNDVSIGVSADTYVMLQAEAWSNGFTKEDGEGDVSALLTALGMGFYRMTPELEQEFDSFSIMMSLAQWDAWTQYGVEPPIVVSKAEFEHLQKFYAEHSKK